MVKIHLAELLARRHWKPKYFSELTGIRYNTILDLCNEVAVSVKLEHIKLICDTLECDSFELIEYKYKK